MEEAIRMVKGIFSSIRLAIRTSERTINEDKSDKIKITEV